MKKILIMSSVTWTVQLETAIQCTATGKGKTLYINHCFSCLCPPSAADRALLRTQPVSIYKWPICVDLFQIIYSMLLKSAK